MNLQISKKQRLFVQTEAEKLSCGSKAEHRAAAKQEQESAKNPPAMKTEKKREQWGRNRNLFSQKQNLFLIDIKTGTERMECQNQKAESVSVWNIKTDGITVWRISNRGIVAELMKPVRSLCLWIWSENRTQQWRLSKTDGIPIL